MAFITIFISLKEKELKGTDTMKKGEPVMPDVYKSGFGYYHTVPLLSFRVIASSMRFGIQPPSLPDALPSFPTTLFFFSFFSFLNVELFFFLINFFILIGD